LFLGLGLAEWLCGGTNLPPRPVVLPDAVLWPARTAVELAGIFTYHLWLLCTLWAAALVEYDGHRPPRLMLTIAMLIGVHAPLIWPWLHPLPAFGNGDYALPGAVDGTLGLAAGVLLGALGVLVSRTQFHCVSSGTQSHCVEGEPTAASVAGRSETTSYGSGRSNTTSYEIGRSETTSNETGRSKTASYWPQLLPAACVGVYLGWQAACVIAPAAVAACLGIRFLSRPLPALRRIGPTAVLLVLTLAAVLGWARWAEWLTGV